MEWPARRALSIADRDALARRIIALARWPLLPFLLFAAPPAAAANRDDEQAVLAAVQEFFDALAAKSETRIMAVVIPEGTISAQRTRDGKLQFRADAWPGWAKSLAGASETLEERMHSPKVRVKGTIASVWTYYTFWRNGAFSHCGIDNVDLAKVDGRWRIVNLSYTAETEGCRRP